MRDYRHDDPTSMPRFCEGAGKYAYDKKGALSQANRLRGKRGVPHKHQLRVYECDFGPHWHIAHGKDDRERFS